MRFEDRATEEALFRYGVISPLLEPGLDRAEQSRRSREILDRPPAGFGPDFAPLAEGPPGRGF